jgi:hypothetical protein
MKKLIRAPFLILSLLAGLLGIVFVLGWISIGGWWEAGIRAVFRPSKEIGWLYISLGLLTWVGVGLTLPIIVSYHYFGVVGAILAPLIILIGVAVIDRW